MCYYDDVYYEKCGNIENHHFQTILVDYCDWKHKHRHDPEKICPTIYAEVRKLTIENDDCPVCFKEGLCQPPALVQDQRQSQHQTSLQGQNHDLHHAGHSQNQDHQQFVAQVQYQDLDQGYFMGFEEEPAPFPDLSRGDTPQPDLWEDVGERGRQKGKRGADSARDQAPRRGRLRRRKKN
jgi:hypothetical protein